MLDRRDEDRYEVELLVRLATVDFINNVATDAYLLNFTKDGAFLVAPLYFKDGERVSIKVDMLGGPLEIYADVISCQEDETTKMRFDQTYSLRVKFVELIEADWKRLLMAIGK